MEHTAFEAALQAFVTKALSKKYGTISPRRHSHAASQEAVKYIINLEELELSENAIALWDEPVKHEITRIAKLKVTICGKDTLSVELPTDSNLAKDISDCTHRLPVAFCFGCPPIYEEIAEAGIPEWTDVYLAGGLMTDANLVTTDGFTQDLELPADCEMILEGYIQKSESNLEGTVKVHLSCMTKKL